MNESLQWMMKAMERVKMNDRNDPPPDLKSESVQTTTNSAQ